MYQAKTKNILMLIMNQELCTVWAQCVNKFIALNTGTKSNTE